MDDFRTLPKEYAVLIFLKLLLVILLILSIGLLFVGGVAAYLYFEHYPTSTIVTFSIMAWVVFILILVCLMYRNQSQVNQKKSHLIQLVKNELLATLALRSLNIALRKWRRQHEQ